MGIDITSYRARIGTFVPPNQKVQKLWPTKHKISSTSKLSRIVIYLVLLSSLIISVQNNPRKISGLQDYKKCIEFSLSGRPLTWPHRSCRTSTVVIPYNPNYSMASPAVTDFNFFARYVNGNGRKNGIKLAHLNLGGGYLINKINEVENIIAGYKPHVLGISETRFQDTHNIDDLLIEDYKVYFSKTLQNPNLKTSRIAVFVHRDLVVKERLDLMNDKFSSVWLELGLPRQKKILVSNLYREWQYLNQGEDHSSLTITSQLDRWSGFITQWEKAIAEDKEIHCLGDANIDFLRWSDSGQNDGSSSNRLQPLINLLFDRIIPHGFVQLISVATRHWPGQPPSGLDHFYTNRPRKVSDVHAYYHGASDHKLIFAKRYSKSIISNPRIIKKRCYKLFDPEKFLEALRNTSWWDLYSCKNVDHAVELFTNKINSILNIMAPIKNIQVRAKYAPWLSENTKLKLVERDLAKRTASESGKSEDWKTYKVKRNELNNVLRKEKERWQKGKLQEFSEDSSSTWKNVKTWLGWTSGGPPTKLVVDGVMQTKPKNLATIMNDYFVNKVKNLRENLPEPHVDPLTKIRSFMSNRNCSFKLRAMHPDEIEKIINNLKSTKSCGKDFIDSYILKLAKKELIPALTHIVNLSIATKVFPKLWKCAKVIPLHKKDEVIYPKNFRPVALLPIASKVLEKAIFMQLVVYLEGNNLLHPFHHGFRAKHNTSTALLQMLDVWLHALEDNKLTAVIMLDMSAAFDVVDHEILLDKLKLYGLDMEACSWIESYLTQRSQQVMIDGALSDPLELEAGVPQGSILGPLLYICFTNDLPEVVHDHLAENGTLYNTHCRDCGTICCFADDSTYSKSSSDPQELKADIETKYRDIANYMSSNKLVLNSDKTHLLVMTSALQHRKNSDFGITLDTGTEEIKPVHHEKLLGGFVSNDFKWNEHIRNNDKSIFRTLVSRVNALSKITRISSFKTRKMLANGIVMSRLIYLIQLWGGATEYLIDFLQVIQNRAARLVTQKGWYTPVKTHLTHCGWLSIRQLVVYHRLLLVYKIRTEGKPVYFVDKFSSLFYYRTRLSSTGGIRKEKKLTHSETQNSFVPASIKLWNELPPDVRQAESLLKFKTKLKTWVLQNIPFR